MEGALKKVPFHHRQHAYRTARSTESAISEVLNEVEKGMKGKNFSLATFIDISSAPELLPRREEKKVKHQMIKN